MVRDGYREKQLNRFDHADNAVDHVAQLAATEAELVERLKHTTTQ